MTFAEYLWKLLTRPYKLAQDTILETKNWVDVLGSMLDDAKQSMFQLRRNWIIGTASRPALEIHGEARRFLRRPGESVEAYRLRVETAFDVYMLGGTVPGIIAGLTSLGYPNARVLEALEGYSWAEFKVAFNLDDMVLAGPDNYRNIREVIKLTKAAHTMPAGLVLETHHQMNLYLASALRQGGKQTIFLPRPEFQPSTIYRGQAIRTNGHTVIPMGPPNSMNANITYATAIRQGGRTIIG